MLTRVLHSSNPAKISMDRTVEYQAQNLTLDKSILVWEHYPSLRSLISQTWIDWLRGSVKGNYPMEVSMGDRRSLRMFAIHGGCQPALQCSASYTGLTKQNSKLSSCDVR